MLDVPFEHPPGLAGKPVRLPQIVHGMQRTDVPCPPLDEGGVTSPIVMATRLLDDSQNLRNLIYAIYDDEDIANVREAL